MTLQHLKIFIAVCREGGVTLAAEKLYISQPAASQAIRELERHYGVKLFDRGGRRLSITPAGERMFREALNIVSGLDEMEAALRNWETAGKIRIGSSITIGTELLPGLVKRLQRQFPELSVYALVNSSEVIERRLLDNELDLAVIEGEVHSDALAFRAFLSDELGVYCHEDDPLNKKEAASIGDIAKAPLLLREPNSAAREMVDALLKVNGYSAAPVRHHVGIEAVPAAHVAKA
jgi:DNA-binding transcriptional LysR family regulator